MSVARGRSCSRIARNAAGWSKRAPLVATITGSTISGGRCAPPNQLATSRIIPADNSIPVLIARGGSSAKTASSCCLTIAGVAACIARTPRGFCAVRQVMALVPCTPSAANVFRSACIPAPPPLSEPAMVKATGQGGRWFTREFSAREWAKGSWKAPGIQHGRQAVSFLREPLAPPVSVSTVEKFILSRRSISASDLSMKTLKLERAHTRC